MFDQRLGRRLNKFGTLGELAALGRNAPDATVGYVAARVAEIDLAVLDDRVVPVGDVDRAVRPLLDVDGAEGGVRRFDDIGHEPGRVARAGRREGEPADAVRAEVAGDEAALPVVGEMASRDDLEAAILGAAGIESLERAGRAGGGVVGCAGEADVDALAARTVGLERLAEAVEVVAPRVPHAAREDLEPPGVGAELPHAARVEPADAIRRFDVAVDVHRLVHVQVAVVPPAQRVK